MKEEEGILVEDLGKEIAKQAKKAEEVKNTLLNKIVKTLKQSRRAFTSRTIAAMADMNYSAIYQTLGDVRKQGRICRTQVGRQIYWYHPDYKAIVEGKET